MRYGRRSMSTGRGRGLVVVGNGEGGGDVQAPAMMIRRIHFSGDMLARVDWTLVVKRWPIVEARLASSSIVVVGGGLVAGARAWFVVVKGRGL